MINLLINTTGQKSHFKFFFYGFIYAFGFLIIYLSWISNPFLVFETTSPYAILSILLPIFLSIFFGLFFCIYKYLSKPIYFIITTPFLFTAIEFLISNLFYGFPWISSSLVLSNNIFGFYIIKYLGSLPSAFLTISIFLIPTLFIYKNIILIFKNFFLFLYAPILLVLLITIISNNSSKNLKEISIEVHQILSSIDKKKPKETNQNIINIINNSNSDYIIFAENNFPYLVNQNEPNNLLEIIKNDKKIIIGATTYQDNKYYNSFLLLEKNQIQFFDKKILVPFGEFLPFRKYLKFMENISGSTDFQIGKTNRILITEDNFRIFPIICYEVIFDKIFKNIEKNNIDIMINITNDSWFGTKLGPYQHFYIARIKSLIANKPLIRVSNNGISAIIDNKGKIIKSTKLNKISNLKHELKISKNKSYYFLHKLLSYYLLISFIFLFIINLKNKHEQ